jgi:hypothetical protein
MTAVLRSKTEEFGQLYNVIHTGSDDSYFYVVHDVEEQRASRFPNSFMNQLLACEIEVESSRRVWGM